MKTRIKLTIPSIHTRERLNETLGEIRDLTLHRNQLQLQLETRKKQLDDQYAPAIDADREKIELLADCVRSWAEANPVEFGALKSIETPHATIGWRIGPPAVKPKSGGNWKTILEKMKQLGGKWRGYIRTVEEVNRAALITDRLVLSSDDFREIGVRIIQEEAFFIEPKIEQPENRATA